MVVLPLCVCLLAACSMRTARNQVVLPVSASETERLRDLLSGKRIDASFADGTHLGGRVKEIQEGLLSRRHQEDQRPQFGAASDFRTFPRIGSPPCSSPGMTGTRDFLLGALGTLGGGYGLGGGVALTATRGLQ